MAESGGPGDDDKNKGNVFFSEGKWGRAYQSYTTAIKADPNNHIYYSNRCACFLKMDKDVRALEDAEKCVELKPDWPKGYFRKGVALAELLRHAEAILAINTALKLTLTSNQAPTSEMLTKLKEIVERVELSQDKNLLRLSDPNTLVTQEEYDAYTSKMKGGNEGTITPEEIEQAVLTAWTCAMARVQSNSTAQKRRPFVLFHTGYTAEAGTGLIPLVDNLNYDLLAGFMRRLTTDLKLNYIIVVALKSNTYGLPYEKNPKAATWKYKKKDGVFIQVDTKGRSSVYFIPVERGNQKGIFTFTQTQKEELEWDTFHILPPILNK